MHLFACQPSLDLLGALLECFNFDVVDDDLVFLFVHFNESGGR
jgi:hypothetical protein